MILYIVRHGQSANNALADVRQRVCDPDLTPLGRRQAEMVARHLAMGKERLPSNSTDSAKESAGYGITHLYCSPMWRALLTARSIGEALGLATEVWTGIHEYGGIYLDHGEAGGIVGYPGRSRREIGAEFPGTILPEEIGDNGWWPVEQGFEERGAFLERVNRVAESLRERAGSEERIALVSHGDFIDGLLKALFYQGANRDFYHTSSNAGISRLDFHGNGRIVIRYLDRVDHLPVEMVT